MVNDWEARYDELTAGAGVVPESERADRLFALTWDIGLAESPEMCTYLGVPGHDHEWTDLSPEAVDRRRRQARLALDVARTIDGNALDDDRRLSLDLFLDVTAIDAELAQFPGELLQVSPIGGVQQDAAMVLALNPLASESDGNNYSLRLAALADHIDQAIELLREGVGRGITHPGAALGAVLGQTEAMCAPPADHPLMAPLAAAGDTETFRAATATLVEQVIPAFERLRTFLSDTYLPAARESTAWTSLPDGDAWYAALVRHHTTTNLSPGEIHEIGLEEVQRIRSAMDEVVDDAGFSDRGGFAAYVEHLRTDPIHYYEDPDSLVAGYRNLCKRIDPGLPRLFGTLPRLPYGVEPVPDHSAPGQTTAYYLPGSPTAGRAGVFFANTFDLTSRPRWEMEALTLHEAVPGHHLQIALAQELEAVPDFRSKSWSGFTAYIEGWGLYAESLGADFGLYTEPASRFGRLSFEMWRAVRLVVDTGMHALGWSRQQAIDLFSEQTGKAGHDIAVEVDRYLVLAGQALAYKLGELSIQGLRAEAEEAHGGSFDVRAFHDVVLGAGPLPLGVLEGRVRRWIDGQGR